MDTGTGHPVPHPIKTDSYTTGLHGLLAELKLEADPLQKGEGYGGQLSLSTGLGD
jgi:hypothetical protein